MTLEEMFEKAIAKAFSKYAVITIGKGKAVDVTLHGCTVERDGQPELYDVLFHASDEQPASYYTIIPKEGSEVIYGIVENQATEAVILKCSEVEKVLVKVGAVVHEIDATGHLIKKDDDTAAKILSALVDEVSKIIVINGRSPNKVALAGIKQRINDLFN